jgi:hypothetical protein
VCVTTADGALRLGPLELSLPALLQARDAADLVEGASVEIAELRFFRATKNAAASQAGVNSILGRVILMETHFATLIALFSMLLARVAITHRTISEAAALRKYLTGHGSVAGIRKLIARGALTLEVIPGTRTSGIPIEQVYPQWLPINAARAALEREHGRARRARRCAKLIPISLPARRPLVPSLSGGATHGVAPKRGAGAPGQRTARGRLL